MNKILTIILFMTILSVFAQQSKTETPAQPYIEVTGTAEMKIFPDIIYITIILKDKIVNRSTYNIAQQEQKLKSLLSSLNISLDNLTLSDAGSQLIIYKKKEKGVEETKEYRLKVSNVEQVNAVFKGLHENEIKEAVISGTDHTKIDELRRQVRINAIMAAKEKATYLLAAIGEEPGSPIVITEATPSTAVYNQSNVAYYDKEDYPDIINFTAIKISFSYYVKYSIK